MQPTLINNDNEDLHLQWHHHQPNVDLDSSSHPQSTFETFTATPSTLQRASPSPPANLPNVPAHLINRPSSATNSTTNFAPTSTTATMPPMNASTRRNNEQMQVVRARILARVTEKYPDRPKEFRERKTNKQMATLFPDSTPAANGSFAMGNISSVTSTPTPLPQDAVDRRPAPQRFGSSTNVNAESSSNGGMELDDDLDRAASNDKPKPNSTNASTPRESSQMQDFPQASRSAVSFSAASANGAVNGNSDANMDDLPHTNRQSSRPRLRSPNTAERMKSKGVLMGFYRLSDVANNADKHAVYGKIDKGGDLFTTVSKETRYGSPVPSQQYLASKCQCSSEKIGFEPHLVGLNKAQLKQYVLRRLDEDWTTETDEARKVSELQIAAGVKNDKSLAEKGVLDAKKHPTVVTGVKRDYAAFADDNDATDEEDESPLSEINETNFLDTDDEDAFVPTGRPKKSKVGRKSITARTAKGDEKDTDMDDIKDGVFIGFWKGTPAESNEDRHAVYSYLDSRDSLWSRVFHTTKDGRHINQDIPFPRGTVKWDDIILDDSLKNMDREDVKEHVRQVRPAADHDPNINAVKKERKPRKSHPEQPIKVEPANALKSKTNAILLGHWKLSLEPNDADKNAVYGYVDTSGRFNLQVRKHTRDGRELVDINPEFPGNGRVQKENMVLEDHLKNLTHAEVQAYTRKAILEGLPELSGQELKDAELRVAAEIIEERPADFGQEKAPEEQPRQKRKYTRRATRTSIPTEVTENAAVDEASGMRAPSRPQSRLSGMMFDPTVSMANGVNQQSYMQAPPQMFSPNSIPGVTFGPNNSLMFNGVEYLPRIAPQPPTIDESGTTITNEGLKYIQKNNGTFKGKFVHAQRQLITVNGDDYAEYRVLVQTDI